MHKDTFFLDVAQGIRKKPKKTIHPLDSRPCSAWKMLISPGVRPVIKIVLDMLVNCDVAW
jgi:hypothetical protein